MVLSIKSLEGKEKILDHPVGEARKDVEGKGYFHKFTKEELIAKGFFKKEVKELKVDFDINKDGKVDEKDVSLAAKVLRTVGRKGRKKK